MPVKTKNHNTSKKHTKNYAKVYWPYLPLVLVMLTTLALGHSSANRAQRVVLAYSTNVTTPGLLQATNDARKDSNEATLSLNAQLATAAQNKANDMAKRNYWSHVTPDGLTPWSFVDNSGYQYQKAGENLAYGFANSNETTKGWLNSSEHRANLLDPAFSAVGFGIAKSDNFQSTGPETVVVAIYGEPLTASTYAQKATKTLGFNTVNTIQPATKTISKAQSLTNGQAPWIGFVLGILVGGGAIFLVLSHGLHWHRSRKKGQHFTIKHPLRDATIVAAILLAILLSQTIGTVR
jgi:uncharacterized protein YkwD